MKLSTNVLHAEPRERLESGTTVLWVFGVLLVLSVCPFWLTRLLPMQDYPQFLVFARAYADCQDPASPFAGTYVRGFPLSPLVLPILLTRALSLGGDLEMGGRLMWTLYAVALPVASLDLMRALGRDTRLALLVFPLVISYWVVGGFFAFATAAPLLVLGLAASVRWLLAPSWRRGLALAAVACALHLWHALAFAQLVFDFLVLWGLVRGLDARARLAALVPLAPALALFATWMLATVAGRAPATHAAAWPPLLDNAKRFFEYVGPIVPGAPLVAAVLALPLVAGAALWGRGGTPPSAVGRAFRTRNPFGWLALLAALSFFVLPSTFLGVDGIHNRQPWLSALLCVFACGAPPRPVARRVATTLVAATGACVLLLLSRRFLLFGRQTEGASRLIDRIGPRQTLLAPMGLGATEAFPGKPLIALELYATVRRGGLPNTSFAGYPINVIRYVGGQNPMPGVGRRWVDDPGLSRFDYVLLRSSSGTAMTLPGVLRPAAQDGVWRLYDVCNGPSKPACP